MAHLVTWICWGAVVLVWIVGAVYGGRTSSVQRRRRGSDAAWQLGAAIAAVVAYRLARPELNRVVDRAWWIELPGLVLLVVSTAFTVWARFRLGRMWSASPNVLRTGHELRTDGPYAVTRHPIYTGLLGMILGTVLLNGLGDSLALLVVTGVVLAVRIPIEERLMSETFPEEYARYRERVPRLVPGLHPPRARSMSR